jgi:hypothetical protein
VVLLGMKHVHQMHEHIASAHVMHTICLLKCPT